MKNQITSRDYELISAYLDNQLSEKERALLETRLKVDPELRKELHEITKTRLLVRSLPQLRAPHNYYVNATAVRVHPTLRLAPVFGIVSAVASVLLALVIFGSTFLNSNSQVVMAPALAVSDETTSIQQEVQRSAASPFTTTEEAPVVMMGAPLIASPTPNTGALNLPQTEIASPTTVYLYALPPTSTPESLNTLNEEQAEIARFQCEEFYGGGAYPTLSSQNDCPTPTATSTPTFSQYPQDINSTPSPTPSNTPTPTTTPTQTPTITPTPPYTPSPTSSLTPSPTEVPPSVQKFIPTAEVESPIGLTAPNPVVGAGNPTPSALDQADNPGTSPNISFLNYLLLTIEISLASIAIIAGIAAIILRVRTGR
jgi:hypothetical protein